MDIAGLLSRLALALGIGLLIGLERDWKAPWTELRSGLVLLAMTVIALPASQLTFLRQRRKAENWGPAAACSSVS